MMSYLAPHVHIVHKLLKMNTHNYLYDSEISPAHHKIVKIGCHNLAKKLWSLQVKWHFSTLF